jgi:lipoate-protein ligase A
MKPDLPATSAVNGGCHGEYKAPGGKLVVVDFQVEHERLRHVQIAGDFFLYPDEALARIRHALEGSPLGASRDERTAAIRASLTPTDELVGVTCDAIAVAVDRALAGRR